MGEVKVGEEEEEGVKGGRGEEGGEQEVGEE